MVEEPCHQPNNSPIQLELYRQYGISFIQAITMNLAITPHSLL